MAMPSRFDDAEQYVRRYALEHGELPTKKMVAQHVNICADTMSAYARRFASMGLPLPNTRPHRNIAADDLRAFVDAFQTEKGRLPLVGEFRKHFDFRGAQLRRFLDLLEAVHGIALPEFAPRALPEPQPDPEMLPEPEAPVGRSVRNEREPRSAEECPHGLRMVVYHRKTRTLRWFSDREAISEAATPGAAVVLLSALEREGVHTAIA